VLGVHRACTQRRIVARCPSEESSCSVIVGRALEHAVDAMQGSENHNHIGQYTSCTTMASFEELASGRADPFRHSERGRVLLPASVYVCRGDGDVHGCGDVSGSVAVDAVDAVDATGDRAAQMMSAMSAGPPQRKTLPLLLSMLDNLIYCLLDAETSRQMSDMYADALERLQGVLRKMRRFGPVRCSRLEAHAFGSTVCGMHILRSDLDVCIDGHIDSAPQNSWQGYEDGLPPGSRLSEVVRFSRQKFLHELADLLIREGDADEQTLERIIHARVPVFNYVDRMTGVKCDIIVGGQTFRFKATVLKILTDIDWRFAALTRLVKLFAAHHGLVDASMGMLNSYSLKLMVLFHLQCRPVPVLPRLSLPAGPRWDARWRPIRNDLGEGFEHDPECRRRMHAYVAELRRHLASPEQQAARGKNGETLAELFVSFIRFLKDLTELERMVGDGALFQKLKVDVWTGSFTYASEQDSNRAYHIYIKDPFEEKPDNAARSLSLAGEHAIHEACDGVCRRLDEIGDEVAYESVLKIFDAAFGTEATVATDERCKAFVGRAFKPESIIQTMRASAAEDCLL